MMAVSSFIVGFVDHSFLEDEKQARKKIPVRHTHLQIAPHRPPRVDLFHWAIRFQQEHEQVYGMAIPDSVAYGALSHAKEYDSKKLDPLDGQVFCTSQVSGKLQHNR
jgi:hypothetical protein